MATVDLTTSAYPGNFGAGFRPTPGKVEYFSRVFDCTEKTLLAATTDYTFMKINAPLGGFMRTTIVAHTGEGATATLDVGTATSDSTTIASSANIETTGTVTAGTTVALAAGETIIYINPDHDLDTAVFGIYCEIFIREQ